MEDSKAVTYLGTTNFRSPSVKFGIKAVDRAKHMYVIGKSGTGKSTFIENLAIQDIQSGHGIAFLDPHGGSALKLLEYVPEWRRQDVVFFAPYDTEFPISFNVMEDPGDADKRTKVADGLLSAFKKIWVDAWSARMEYILMNTVLALLEYPDSTLLSINRMLTDKDFRKAVVNNITNHSVKAFWIDEYGKWDAKYANEAGAAIQNKIGQFTSNPLIRNMVGQPKSTVDFRQIMDGRKIFIADLSKGRMGDQNSGLVGAMIITKIYLAAMSRAELAPQMIGRAPSFFFYADEFQNFANDSFTNILSEARKYKLCLTLVHQYVNQLPEALRDAIVGNVGSMIVFRIGPDDAELFEKQFSPVFKAEDFTNLGFRQMYLSISIDGTASKPFSALSLEMIPNTTDGARIRQESIALSRQQYAQPREQVEKAISDWYRTKGDTRTPEQGGPVRQVYIPGVVKAAAVPKEEEDAPIVQKTSSYVRTEGTKPLPVSQKTPPVRELPKLVPKPTLKQEAPAVVPPTPAAEEPLSLSDSLSKMIDAFDVTTPQKITIAEKKEIPLEKPKPVIKPAPLPAVKAPEPKKFVSLQGGVPKFISKDQAKPKTILGSAADKSNKEAQSSLKDTIAKVLSQKKLAPDPVLPKETVMEAPSPQLAASPIVSAVQTQEVVTEKEETIPTPPLAQEQEKVVPEQQTTGTPPETFVPYTAPKTGTKREVPEDVLRRILS